MFVKPEVDYQQQSKNTIEFLSQAFEGDLLKAIMEFVHNAIAYSDFKTLEIELHKSADGKSIENICFVEKDSSGFSDPYLISPMTISLAAEGRDHNFDFGFRGAIKNLAKGFSAHGGSAQTSWQYPNLESWNNNNPVEGIPGDQGFVFSVTLKDPLPIKVDGRSRKKGKDLKGLIQLLKQGFYHHLKDNLDCQVYVSIWGSDGKAQLKQTLRVSDWEDQRTEEHRITPSEVPTHLQYLLDDHLTVDCIKLNKHYSFDSALYTYSNGLQAIYVTAKGQVIVNAPDVRSMFDSEYHRVDRNSIMVVVQEKPNSSPVLPPLATKGKGFNLSEPTSLIHDTEELFGEIWKLYLSGWVNNQSSKNEIEREYMQPAVDKAITYLTQEIESRSREVTLAGSKKAIDHCVVHKDGSITLIEDGIKLSDKINQFAQYSILAKSDGKTINKFIFVVLDNQLQPWEQTYLDEISTMTGVPYEVKNMVDSPFPYQGPHPDASNKWQFN